MVEHGYVALLGFEDLMRLDDGSCRTVARFEGEAAAA